MAHQQYTDGYDGLDVYNFANLYHLKMHRRYVTADLFDMGTITDDINFLMNNANVPTMKLWRQASTHVVVYTGTNQ